MSTTTLHPAIQWLYTISLLVVAVLPLGSAQAQALKLVLPIGHTMDITSAAYSPNGKFIATGSLDKTVKVWDIATGTLLLNLTGNVGALYQVSYNSTGTKLLTASRTEDYRFDTKVWDATTGTLLLSLPGTSKRSYDECLGFSPDGRRILTVADNVHYTLWDTSGGKALLTLDGTEAVVPKEVSLPDPKAIYSPDGKNILTYDFGAKLWNAATGALLKTFKNPNPTTYIRDDAVFSPDGKRVAFAYSDKAIRVWDIARGVIVLTIRDDIDGISKLSFSPDSHQLLARRLIDGSFTTISWNAVTGTRLFRLPKATMVGYTPDHQRLVTVDDLGVQTWQLTTGKYLQNWPGLPAIRHVQNRYGDQTAFSTDHKRLYILSDAMLRVWDTTSGKLLQTTPLKSSSRACGASVFSPDGQQVATALDSTIRIWEASTGRSLLTIHNRTAWRGAWVMADVLTLDYSPDGRCLVTTSYDDGVAQVWNTTTGALLLTLQGHKEHVRSAKFSADGKRIVTAAWDGTAKVWDATTGRLQLDLPDHQRLVQEAIFSSDGKKIIVAAYGGYKKDSKKEDKNAYSISVWNAQTGKLLQEIKDPDGGFHSIKHLAISPGGKYLLASVENANEVGPREVAGKFEPHYTGYANVFTVSDGQLLQELQDGAALKKFNADPARLAALHSIGQYDEAMAALQPHAETHGVAYSPDGHQMATIASDNTTRVWDSATGGLVSTYRTSSGYLSSVSFSPDSHRLLVSHTDVVEIIDLARNESLFQYVPVRETDFLTVDRFSRYDGTPAARDLLYFTCGSEIISLNQVKDQLWVPGLTSRLAKGDIINAKTLADLHLCGLVPEVKPVKGDQGYRYQIVPRQGGLGETVLSVNGIEVKRRQPGQLTKTAAGYELAVSRAELAPYFVAGKSNTVTVKAYTRTDNIASRGADVVERNTATSKARPNLYAVMVGVSDYKGDNLDLSYAAKDAQDLAKALGSSARKLLNTDGQQHVFMYNLTTGDTHDQLPEKIGIRQTFEEIGRKATANDIVLVFLAGHGVVSEQNKKFYFLTADASASTAIDAVAEVGISMQELTQWMQPSRMKAQKRVLILDACNSGQAINDQVHLDHNVAARADDQAQQAKALDRLNEQAGMFILAASASNQRAYEMSGYAQGLLTYSLLEALKNHADILEEQRFLNVGRWFDAARQTVSDVAQQLGRQQQSQVQATTNFNIGVIDAEVLAGIVLPKQKVLFSASNIQNQDDKIATDDLGIGVLLDEELHSLVARGTTPDLAFADNTASPDAYRLTGRYEVRNDRISVRVDIRKGKDSLKRLEESCTRSELKQLAARIAAHATEWVAQHK